MLSSINEKALERICQTMYRKVFVTLMQSIRPNILAHTTNQLSTKTTSLSHSVVNAQDVTNHRSVGPPWYQTLAVT